MAPGSDFYKKLALDCSAQQIGVDLFAFSGQFTDLPTICEWLQLLLSLIIHCLLLSSSIHL